MEHITDYSAKVISLLSDDSLQLLLLFRESQAALPPPHGDAQEVEIQLG